MANPYPQHDQSLAQALALHRQGEWAQAERLYRLILRSDPGHAPARINLGAALLEQGRLTEALESLEEALALQPDNPIAYNTYGNALVRMRRMEQALTSYGRAIALDPGYATPLSNRCEPLSSLGRHSEALESADQALRLNPHSAGAINNRGKALAALSRNQEALQCFELALQLRPDWVTALLNRSNMYLRLGEPELALRDAERALRSEPHGAAALNARGAALRLLQRPHAALQDFEAALRNDATLQAAHGNRGMTLLDLQRPAEALSCFDAAMDTSEDCSEAHHGRGLALTQLQRWPEAAIAFDTALAIQPGIPYARGMAMHARLQCAHWQGYDTSRDALLDDFNRDEPVDEPFSFLTLSDSAAQQLDCSRRYMLRRHPPGSPDSTSRAYGHAKLRIAYLSGDFGDHPMARLMVGVFEAHDRERFEVIALALRPPASGGFAQRVRASFDRYIDVSGQSQQSVARLVRELEVDILIDLMGYTRGTGIGVLALRPAPVQVSYLGFPGTSGAPYVDYLIADERVIPAHSCAYYSEAIVYLPECFQANDARASLPPASNRRDEDLRGDGLVLCCFNATCKLNPSIYDVWCRLLEATPRSLLWLLGADEVTRGNLRYEAGRRGIDAERLVFARRVGYEQHLARLQLADLFLDTFPFNAGATASDALRCGVPVVTCCGEAFASRMAASLLHCVGLRQLIATDLKQYEQLARELLAEPLRLAALKHQLLAGHTAAALFDPGRFCTRLESAYVQMNERRRQGGLPATFRIGAD